MSTQKQPLVNIEVVFATQAGYRCIALSVEKGTTLKEAVEQSGLLQQFPEIALDGAHKVGVYNKIKTLETQVNEGDRVEIYRPLHQDAMSARAQRAKTKKLSQPKKAKDRV